MTDEAKNARREYMRRWREKNRLSVREYSRNWRRNNGREYLQAFDFLTDTFNRCERNFALSTKWDELTSPVVDSF